MAALGPVVRHYPNIAVQSGSDQAGSVYNLSAQLDAMLRSGSMGENAAASLGRIWLPDRMIFFGAITSFDWSSLPGTLDGAARRPWSGIRSRFVAMAGARHLGCDHWRRVGRNTAVGCREGGWLSAWAAVTADFSAEFWVASGMPLSPLSWLGIHQKSDDWPVLGPP